ncbi:DEAD/DEAH box helicase [Actinomyces marmotae]|uniref:DEAD/DEAH box helicase n=1 Tax=Actinomyces marmotae TaxID=2737173 RepID=UPI0013571E25|nr:DEAD/DEAH box helicase [Actinomyces marmotae]
MRAGDAVEPRYRHPAALRPPTGGAAPIQTGPLVPATRKHPSAPATSSTASGSAAQAPAPTFAGLGVDPDLVADLAARGFTAPFPIQSATLPDTLAGRDVLGRGRTGSGKTLAFSLPLVQRLADEDCARAGHPIGLVLAPTRELALQIAETIKPLAAALDLTVTTIFGGVNQNPQVKALRAGVDIVVACPGRLLDLIAQGHCSLDEVSITIIDEADHMADLGFLPSVRRILRATPAGGQRMLFSATLDNGVDAIVREFLHNPLQHAVDPASSPVTDMEHRVWLLADKTAKDGVVIRLASGTGQRILFTRTKHLARRLARKLVTAGIPAVELQGNMSQGARERAMGAFTSGAVRVMVATDIAARGIDVSGVELVVHVDPPAEHKAYLHRSGRTARAGASGTVVTLVLPEQRKDVQVLLKKARIKAEMERVRPDDGAVTALVGEQAELVAAEDMPDGVAIKGGRPTGAGAQAPARGAHGRRAGEASRAGSRHGARHGGRRTGAGQKPPQGQKRSSRRGRRSGR